MDDSLDMLEVIGDFVDPEPTKCEYCGGEIEYSGLGEYTCNECKKITRNSYAKVRNYIEEHPGATAIEVSARTGVSKATIKKLLKDNRIEVKPYKNGESDPLI